MAHFIQNNSFKWKILHSQAKRKVTWKDTDQHIDGK